MCGATTDVRFGPIADSSPQKRTSSGLVGSVAGEPSGALYQQGARGNPA
jgi:hypothetical protein